MRGATCFLLEYNGRVLDLEPDIGVADKAAGNIPDVKAPSVPHLEHAPVPDIQLLAVEIIFSIVLEGIGA
jgi:hypothetical protein